MNAIQIAAKIYDARDTAKRILGSNQYAKQLELAKQITQSKATQEKTSSLAAATTLAKEAQSECQSVIALLFLSVIAELGDANDTLKANA